jgi:hypothetical protein
MNKDIQKIQNHDATLFLDRLKSIFADMDREYSKAAAHYGFDCHACADICCQTRFYHHTYIEYLLVQVGFKTLSPDMQAEIESRALNVIQRTAELGKKGKSVRLMCPLNFDNLCVLYLYRPMICRLHGIPHEFRNGADNQVHASGCGTFDDRCSGKSYLKFDRTPFYRDMAGLENKFRQTIGVRGKIKMTIAEMLSIANLANLSFRSRIKSGMTDPESIVFQSLT